MSCQVMLFSEFPFIFKRQLAYKGREKIRYITYLCREKYFLTMRKTINCFIPYRESTAAEQTIHALKESSIVNKIYLLNIEPNKTLSTPEGCEILPVDSLTSSKTMKMIAEKADTPYILLYTKTSALELAYKALERMTDFLQDRECGMVYADHHEWKNGEKKKHPVNDYQPGSVRDDFDFGPLLIFNRTEFILASLQMTEERSMPPFMNCVCSLPSILIWYISTNIFIRKQKATTACPAKSSSTT